MGECVGCKKAKAIEDALRQRIKELEWVLKSIIKLTGHTTCERYKIKHTAQAALAKPDGQVEVRFKVPDGFEPRRNTVYYTEPKSDGEGA